MKPVRFNLDQSMETLTAHSGLALIGLLLSHTRIAKRLIANKLPGVHNPTVTHPDQHAMKTKLRFGRHSPWFPTFQHIDITLSRGYID
jgi:hypothetical protein